ncbi:transcription elongation factor GreA [Treponema lecithinolyticum]|uniref:Transcription elongation factor GreA n=1 Tax=Treponema lecithinolyticum ATCC 700332 TaxID=1321815 RepID=A0ABN0NY30_TRELE|nr:transcription elongation factor GreA [Treponema lecithinolyticum]ERJ92369.1 prokaryotic transcription elongation factor, GreA/GreB domain protein [Treponema lecithinolyticum ATCC 700332]
MSETLVKSVQNMLNEEKWTRAAISNYTKNHFIELAAVVEKAREENRIDEIQKECDDHLAHTKNSIIALYISGMLGLKKKNLDNSALISLVNIFQDNHKNPIVIYLCETILAEDESNKFALRTLANAYREENNEKIWDIYESLVKLDYEEADIAKLLAEKYEKDGNMEDAVDYYKKALLRYVNRKTLNQIKEVWIKLIALIPEEIDFFYLVQRKIAKSISDIRSASLMQELYAYYKDNQKWDTAIDILKLILSIDEKDSWARKELTECFRGKYADHSQLDDYIRISNLTQSWRNVFEAISDFEKHIAFDAKNFVFHRSWGVGIIRKVQDDEISINFGKKFGIRSMSLKMAVNALQPLQKDHIWVLKATKSKEELAKMIKADKAWALKVIIKSFGNSCDFKRIKAELVPSILTAGEWTSWNTGAHKVLENDSTFGVNPNDISMYMVRDRAISQEEKLSNEFKAQKQFFMRIDILMKFAQDADTESELFADMFSYFTGYLRAFSSVNEQTLAAFLVIRRIVTEHPHMNPGISYTFEQLYGEIKNPNALYLALKDTKNTFLRKDFLTCIRTLLPDWQKQYVRLFPTVLQQEMLTALLNNGHTDLLKQLAINSFENFRDYREAALFFFKESQNEDWFKETGISFEKQLITLIHILDVTYREIANHRDTTDNRKINRQVQLLLFKENTLLTYMLENDEDTITRLYTLVNDVRDLDPAIKMNMRNRILEKHPEFKFYGTEEKTVVTRGLIVTAKMLDQKKQQLEHIISVEVPENSKEIGEALAQGDLRENAEYKAAKERQQQLNSTASRLQDEIDRAQIFDPSTVTTARVSFGTTVFLLNKNTGKDEEYTILGPWESDPDNKIISYMSPLGNALMNAKENEELNFEINEQSYAYTVKKIKAVKF